MLAIHKRLLPFFLLLGSLAVSVLSQNPGLTNADLNKYYDASDNQVNMHMKVGAGYRKVKDDIPIPRRSFRACSGRLSLRWKSHPFAHERKGDLLLQCSSA